MAFGKLPSFAGHFDISLPEVMYYLYLPVNMGDGETRVPPNLKCLLPMIDQSRRYLVNDDQCGSFRYIYVSARKGWASPDNPLNRPGWHTDGFGSEDLNFVWWSGPGTRFANQSFSDISQDHQVSMRQFEEQVDLSRVVTYPERALFMLDAEVVHATPIVGAPGCMRQFVKISFSNARYNLENNSHNYLFDYDWQLHPREALRNDPASAQADRGEQ